MKLKQRTIHLLQKIGLTPAEARLYWAIYRFPNTDLENLQHKTDLSRSSVYRGLEALKEKGLIVGLNLSSLQEGIKVTSFKTLRTKLVKEQIVLKKMELKLKEIEDLMQLNAFSSLEDPLEILMNKQDMQEKAQQLLCKKQDHFLAYGSAERLLDALGYQVERDFINNRVKKGITAKACLTEYGEFTKELVPASKKELRPLKIKEDPDQQDHITYVFEDEVIRWQFDDQLGPRAIVMRDPALVKLCENQFKTMWQAA